MLHMTFESFKKAAEKIGLTAADRGNGHWQVRGKLLVNYYPESKNRSAYIAGTTKKAMMHASMLDVFKLATEVPNIDKKAQRKKSYRGHKLRLLQRNPSCNWCQCKLDEASATIDHVIPLSRGGLNNANNFVLACSACNLKRGSQMPEIKSCNLPKNISEQNAEKDSSWDL